MRLAIDQQNFTLRNTFELKIENLIAFIGLLIFGIYLTQLKLKRLNNEENIMQVVQNDNNLK